MTGAATLYCVLAVLFGIVTLGMVVGLTIWIAGNSVSLKESLTSVLMTLAIGLMSIFFAVQTDKTYDLNFAVAMKNIHYERVYEHSHSDNIKVDMEMKIEPDALPNVKE